MANIRVYARIRPDLKVGKASRRQDGNQWLVQEDDQQLSVDSHAGQVTTPSSRSRSSTPTSKGRKRTFRFDRILSASITQEEVFDEVARHIVDHCIDGFNGTIFAYGVTGSGKTYTMEGSCRRYAERGLIARCLSRLYEQLGTKEGCESNVHISYLEVYQDAGYDLLNPGARGQSMMATLPKVTVTQQGETVVIRNLSSHLAADEEVALNLHFQGQGNRRIAETPLNQRSSRSHAIFTVTVATQDLDSEVITRSKLHLVDLAGSERVSKSGVQGQLLSEAKYINLSLHHLEHVIVMLHRKTKEMTTGEEDNDTGIATNGKSRTSHGSHSLHSRSQSSTSTPATRSSTRGQRSRGQRRDDHGHIPYRNSLLTMLLRDSLGGNCHTAMIATLAQNVDGQGEAISTCTFAQRVACITNAVRRNEDLDDKAVIRKLKLRVAELEAEVERYRAKIAAPAISDQAAAGGSTPELQMTTDEKELCMRVMKQFLMGEIADPVAAGIDNVHKFRQCMQFLQLLIRTRAAHSSHTASQGAVNAQADEAQQQQQRPALEPARAGQDTVTSSQEGMLAGSGGHHRRQDNGGRTPAAQTVHHGNGNHAWTPAQSQGSATASSEHATPTLPLDRNPDSTTGNQTEPTHHSSKRAGHGSFQPAGSGQHHLAAEVHQSPVHHRSSQPNSPRSPTSPASPTSPTSPRNKRSPHISLSGLQGNSPRNQQPVFATVFEQQRAKDIQRRSQRLLEVQNVQEQKQHHLILSQLILLENEQRLHLESLSEALATQHARVKALVRQGASQSDTRQEQLAEQSLRRRQVEAHRKLELIQHQLTVYRDNIATETKHSGNGGTEHGAAASTEQERHFRAAPAPASGQATSPRLRAAPQPPASAQDTALVGAEARVGAPHRPQHTTGYTSPTAAAAARVATGDGGFHAGSGHQHGVTPRTDARRVMKALAQEEAKQRELNAHMDHLQQSHLEEELAAKERATRLKLQQFRAMLQGQSVSQQALPLRAMPASTASAAACHPQASTRVPQRQAGSTSESESKHAEGRAASSSNATPALSHVPGSGHGHHGETFATHAWSPPPASGLRSQQLAAAQQQSEHHDHARAAFTSSQPPPLEQETQRHSLGHRQRGEAATSGDLDGDAQHQLRKVRRRQQHRRHATGPTQASGQSAPSRADSRDDKRQQQAAREHSERRSAEATLNAGQATLRHQQSGHQAWPRHDAAASDVRHVPHAREDLPEAEQHQLQHTSAQHPATPALHASIAQHRVVAGPAQGSRREEGEIGKQSAECLLSPPATRPASQYGAGVTATSSAPSSHSAHGHASNSNSSHVHPSSPISQKPPATRTVRESTGRPAQAEAHAPEGTVTGDAAAAASPIGARHVTATGKGKSAGRSSGQDGEKRFMTAAQRQRERVERIRAAQRAAAVIQRAWRGYCKARRRQGR